MKLYRNDAGEYISLGDDGKFSPVKVYENPDTGQRLIHDGTAFVPEPPPERSTLEKLDRGGGQLVEGVKEALATTAGAPFDLVSAGLRSVFPGAKEALKPGEFTDMARRGVNAVTSLGGLLPDIPKPETSTERMLYGAGRGIGDAASLIAPAAVISKMAPAGGVLSNLGRVMMAQPGTQLTAGAVGGGVREATDSPMAGLAAAMATPFAMQGATRLLQPVRPNLPAETQRLAQVAADEGIPLTAGQATGSRPLRNLEAAFDNLPLTSGPQEAIHQAQREAFNRASLSRSGTPGNVATSDVLNAARADIGGRIGEMADRNVLQVTPDLLSKFQTIQDTLKYMPAEAAAPVAARLKQIEEMMVVPPSGGPNITILGPSYRMMDSQLGRSIRSTSNGDLRSALGDLRGTLREAMDASISPADQAAWQQARRQYANLMVTAQAAGGAGGQTAAGNVSPLALRQAVDQSTGKGYVFGQGDQNDLARVGQLFLRPVPDSGTAGRTHMQNLITGGSMFGGGGGAALASGASPLGAALAGGAALVGPRVVQAAYNSPLAQAYLMRGIPGTQGIVDAAPQINSALVGALMGGRIKDALPGPRQ